MLSSIDPLILAAIAAAVLLLGALAVVVQRRQRHSGRRAERRANDALDTLADWEPEASRVLTTTERRAFDVLRQAVPQHMVLAQVPLSRFIRVPQSRSYNAWLQRVGSVSADLLVCDQQSRVLAVIDIRDPRESERSRQRHERMTRVLKAAGVHVMKWNTGSLPTPAEVRTLLLPMLDPHGTIASPSSVGSHSKPLPLIPVADMEELLAAGDAAHGGGALEPVPSTFFDEFDPTPMPSAGSSSASRHR